MNRVGKNGSPPRLWMPLHADMLLYLYRGDFLFCQFAVFLRRKSQLLVKEIDQAVAALIPYLISNLLHGHGGTGQKDFSPVKTRIDHVVYRGQTCLLLKAVGK